MGVGRGRGQVNRTRRGSSTLQGFATGEADGDGEFFANFVEPLIGANLFERPRQAEAPVVRVGAAGCVDALVDGEKFGDHERGVA